MKHRCYLCHNTFDMPGFLVDIFVNEDGEVKPDKGNAYLLRGGPPGYYRICRDGLDCTMRRVLQDMLPVEDKP